MYININQIENKPNFINHEDISMLTIMGSRAYKTNTSTSDWDFYGFIVPPVEYVFPHTKGEIFGFGKNLQRFDQFQCQHVMKDGQEFDLTLYNITKYFQLCMDGNPNMIDSLFTSDDCVQELDLVGKTVRMNAPLFLSQKCYHTFRGMAHSHMARLKNRTRIGERSVLVEKYGYDTKDASHIVRIMLQLEQVLFDGCVELSKNAELVLRIKNGEWSKEEVIEFFDDKMAWLESENLKNTFVVPYNPEYDKIKSMLIYCLELKFGDLSKYGYGKEFN